MINPLLMSDFPEPDVIRVGDTYYMLCTTKHFIPGGVILKSYDLMNWEIISHLFDRLESTPRQTMQGEQSFYGHGMDGGCLRYHNGLFYIYKYTNITSLSQGNGCDSRCQYFKDNQ